MVNPPKTLPLLVENDIVQARHEIRGLSRQLGCTLSEQTKLVAATSEIARNTLVHGRGGSMTVEKIVRDGREGIKIIFMDEGPGISDIDAAMCDGYTTAGSMGLGLPGARRLVDEFDIRSEVGKGTCVTLVNWSGRP